jgi:hypothetical protein
MKRISLIRRRRFLLGAALASLAVAAVLPQAAFARPDEWVTSKTDTFATGSSSAEDAHGLSAGNGYVLPSSDQAAVDQARAAAISGLRADDFAPPQNVAVASTSAGTSVSWGQVGLFSALGLVAIAGALMLALTATRRSTRVAHT